MRVAKIYNSRYLRMLVLLLAMAGTATTVQGQNAGLRDVQLIDDCEGEVRMKFLYYRDAWSGIYCAAVNYHKMLKDAYIYAIVNGERKNLARIDWKGSQGSGQKWYDDSSCRDGGIRITEERGYDFSYGAREVTGGDCWAGASNCKAFYATVTFKVPSSWWGKSLNFGMSGNFDGNFNKSGHVVFMPNIPKVQGLSATSECGAVRLNWTKPNEACAATNYEIFRGNTRIANITNENTTTYRITESNYDDRTYKIRTRQSAAVGNIYSTYQILDASSIKPIESATNVRVDQESCTTNEDGLALALEWTNDPTNLPSKWRIERSNQANFSSRTSTIVNRDRSWFEDDGSSLGALVFNRTYYYRVVAVDDECGQQMTSGTASFTTQGVPNTPTGVTATWQSDNTIRVNWNHDGQRISGFTIERTPVSGDGSTYSEEITNPNTTTWVDNLVENCVSYQYRVVANSYTINSTSCFAGQSSSPSATVTVQINDILNTFGPGFLSGSKGFYPDKVRLDWQYSGNRAIDNFVIYRRTVGTSNWSEIDIVDAPRSYYEDLTAVAGRLYEYGVEAQINDCGGSLLVSDSHPNKGVSYRTVGFRTPTGIVNGRIDYNSGIALQGAKVIATRAESSVQGVGLAFDGIDDQVTIADTDNWFPDGQFSWSSWIMPTAPAEAMVVFSKGNATGMVVDLTDVGNVNIPVYQTNLDTTKRVFLAGAYGDVVNDSVYSLDGSRLLGYFRNDSLYALAPQSILGLANNDTVYQQRSPYNPIFIRKRDGIMGYDTLHAPLFASYTQPTPGAMLGTLSQDTIWHDDSVRAFYINDTLYGATYQAHDVELGDAYGTMVDDTLRSIADPENYSLLLGDQLFNASGTVVAHFDEPYLRSVTYGIDGNPVEGDVFGVIHSDTAWTFNPRTEYVLTKEEPLAIRFQDTLYYMDSLTRVRFFKDGNVFRHSELTTTTGYIAGTPVYALRKEAGFALANGNLETIWRGDTLYRLREQLLGVRTADTVKLVGLEAFYINSSQRLFHLDTQMDVAEVQELMRTDNKDVYKVRVQFAGLTPPLLSDTLYANEYTNITLTYDGTNLLLYANGELHNQIAATGLNTGTAPLVWGSSTAGTVPYFAGHMDELRVWGTVLDSLQVLQDHARYLIGNEKGLLGYWRLDENVGGKVYDASRDDTIEDEVRRYHRRHGTLVNGTAWSAVVPDPEQLGFAGFTDSLGNYTIPAIRYRGSGENFKIVPVYLTHEFDPTNRILFMGEGSSIHNGVNFKDVSSFKVTGFVKVDPAAFGFDRDSDTAPSCFIEGATLLLDGKPLIQNNRQVFSDATGRFELDVPIGEHSIEVVMPGHTFSLGKWPVNTEIHDFQEPISGITFYDETQRHWVGKVVGGDIEGDKFPGFGNAVNNVGAADIKIISLGNECFTKSLTTDSASGEFYVSLPPLKYRVETLKVPTQGPTFNQELRSLADEIIDLTSLHMSAEGDLAKDTTFVVDNGDRSERNIDTVKSLYYHLRKDYIYEAVPEIIVTTLDTTFLFGEDTLLYEDPLGNFNPIRIPLAGRPFQWPIFYSGIQYDLRISVKEQYFNYDLDRANPVVYSSLVAKAPLEIQNEIGGEAQKWTLANGDTIYSFQAADPQTQVGGAFPLTRTLEMTGPRGVKWLPNVGATEREQAFRGYVLGSRPQGDNDFVTVFDEADTATQGGIKMVDFILRDPPGSQSYAFWKEGTTIRNYVDTKFSVGYFGQIQTSAGTSFTLYNFLSGNKLFENKAVMINSVSGKIAPGGRFIRETTYTTRQEIRTNKDPYKPGAPSDLFVGTARNVLVGYADAVQLLPVSKCDEDDVYCTGPVIPTAQGNFRLGKREEFVISPQQNFATTFIYTQDHIEREMVTMREKRNLLFSTPYYTSKLAAGHPGYGMNNDGEGLSALGMSPVTGIDLATDDGPSYTYHRASDPREHAIDLVRFYNNQISLWEQVLANNEKEKIEAMEKAAAGDSDMTNYSFGSGVSISNAAGITTKDRNAFTWDFELTLRRGSLVDTDVTGVKLKLESFHGIQSKQSGEGGTDNVNSTEIGYVLHDKDINDQISVDVIESHLNNGPIFVTKGGRTSCPHEPDYLVKYYAPYKGLTLTNGTVARDQPTIDIFPRSLHNIPAGEKAVFRVVLGNNNYTDSVRYYSLFMDTRTNPGGAELRIDEQRIVKPYPIPMYAGELQEKSLVLKIAATDFNYEDIKIYFHSPCQFNLGTTFERSIADSAYISAYFIPECTDVQLLTPTDKWTLNYEFKDTLDIAIGGYNYNYHQFDNVKFQVKESSESDDRWLTWNTFWHEGSKNLPAADTPHDSIPDDQFNIDYYWDVAQLTDGAYDLRAITTCGPDKVETSSPVYSGVIDRVNPHPFGRPQPRDGVLGPGDEIQIQFNERIEAGKLTWDNFDIRGVLNGGQLRHGASVYFDGSTKDYLNIEGLQMKGRSFTWEFWAKRQSQGETVILSQGRSGTPQMMIGFNQNDRFYLNLNGTMIVSDAQFLDNKWHHFAVTYDHEHTRARLFADGTTLKVSDNFIANYQGEGPIYVGRSGRTPENPYQGQLHELRFWKKPMLLTDITVNFGKRMTGREIGLAGCWPLDEASGKYGRDIVAGRNAAVFADWAVEPGSRSLAFQGNEYLTVPTGHFGYTTEMDFTVEFWFKTAGQNMTLFSNGKGTTEDESSSDWAIRVDDSRRIVVDNDGYSFVAVDSNFMDNDWHHFALVVSRLGNTRAFVDGNLQNQIGSEAFKGFGGDRAYIGARGWKNGTLNVEDQYFVGLLDEVRIWGTARNQAQILRERFYRLLGNELGLNAYYPFEAYQEDAAGVMLLEETVADQLNDTLDYVGTLVGPTFKVETPRIKLQRPIEYVNFVYSVNGDKIIITPTDDDARLENTILDISVRGIEDLNGNKMQSPVTWTAFVDRNQTVWADRSLSFEKKANDPLVFQASLINKGGNLEEFVLDNLPAWLSASETQGSIAPLSSKEITFTVNPGLNIGTYQESLHLRTQFGFDEVLSLNLKVYAPAPEWQVNPSDFQFSMNMIGMLKVEGLFSTDEEDLLGAFIDGECRGVVRLKYVEVYDTYLAYLNLYSNVASGERIVFKIWDASEGQVLTDVTPFINDIPDFNYTFSANQVVGTSKDPIVFSSSQGVLAQRDLPQGWKWISFHLDSDLLVRSSLVLQHLDLRDGDIIWSGNGMFDQYDSVSGLWIGTLAGDNLAGGVGGLSNAASYKLKLGNATQLSYQGAVLEPSAHPITVKSGWNWIGFVSRRNMDLNEALSGYLAQPGDVLKSQHQFAMYDEAIGWIGSLSTMQPGEGYMLWTDSSQVRTFTYPREGLISGRDAQGIEQVEKEVLGTLPFDPYQYPTSMSVVAKLDVPLVDIGAEDEIWAYVGNEVRGIARAISIGNQSDPLFLLTIYGEGTAEEINFRWQDPETGERAIIEAMTFEEIGLFGTIHQPVVLTPKERDNGQEEPDFEPIARAYPNPFAERLDVWVPVREANLEEDISLSIFNAEGKIIRQESTMTLENEWLHFAWDGTNQLGEKAPVGIYLIRVQVGAETHNYKVVRQ